MDKKTVNAVAPLTVGWREWTALPDLGVNAIKAKFDSGARTSSLHTFFIETYGDQGKEMVRFGLHPLQRRKDMEIICSAEILDQRVILDTGGRRDLRYVIRTTLSIAGRLWPIEVNLANREDLRFRFLIGREAMENRLIVNPGRSYILGRTLSKTFVKELK